MFAAGNMNAACVHARRSAQRPQLPASIAGLARLGILQRRPAAIGQSVERLDHALLDAAASQRDSGAERAQIVSAGMAQRAPVLRPCVRDGNGYQ